MILSVPRDELMQVTPAQDKLICGMVKRIEAGNTRFDDVQEMRGYPGVFRWKPPVSLYSFDGDLNFRVVFRWDDAQMEIMAIGHRQHVYSKFAARERARFYAR